MTLTEADVEAIALEWLITHWQRSAEEVTD